MCNYRFLFAAFLITGRSDSSNWFLRVLNNPQRAKVEAAEGRIQPFKTVLSFAHSQKIVCATFLPTPPAYPKLGSALCFSLAADVRAFAMPCGSFEL
jgi:hypothetical protein